MPAEFLMNAVPGSEFTSEQVTVVSWVLPHTDMTKIDHRKETRWPSERWARNRILGEEVNKNLHRHLVTAISDEGIAAVADLFLHSFAEIFQRSMVLPLRGLKDTLLMRPVLVPLVYAMG